MTTSNPPKQIDQLLSQLLIETKYNIEIYLNTYNNYLSLPSKKTSAILSILSNSEEFTWEAWGEYQNLSSQHEVNDSIQQFINTSHCDLIDMQETIVTLRELLVNGKQENIPAIKDKLDYYRHMAIKAKEIYL